MTSYERRGAAFAAGMVVLYAVVVGVRELAAPPLVVTVTLGLLSVACGFCGAYFLARAFGEKLAT